MAVYIGDKRLTVYVGDKRLRSYVGDKLLLGADPAAQIMAAAWTGIRSSNALTQQKSTEATIYDSVPGTGWTDNGHQLVIVPQKACIPTEIKFHTPAIVNSQQSSSITYSIYGSNDEWNAVPDNMSWDTLVSNTTIAHEFVGDCDISLPISTHRKYKYIRLATTWFYGANEYHGVEYHNLQLLGY